MADRSARRLMSVGIAAAVAGALLGLAGLLWPATSAVPAYSALERSIVDLNRLTGNSERDPAPTATLQVASPDRVRQREAMTLWGVALFVVGGVLVACSAVVRRLPSKP